MGFDTMRSFQHLMLNSKTPATSHGSAESRDHASRPTQSLPPHPESRRRGAVWEAATTCDALDSLGVVPTPWRQPGTSKSAPEFQATKMHWSPPPSPRSGSPVACSPLRVDSARPIDTPPLSPTLTVKEKNRFATDLFTAACAGDVLAILSLLNDGAAVNSSSLVHGLFDAFRPAKAGHLSPLAGAASHGQLDAVEILVSHGALINPASHQSACSPLHQAIKNNDMEVTQYLLDNGADVNILNSYNTTPLMYAVKYASLDLVSLILGYKPDLHKMAFFNAAAIHWSVWPCRLEITELLIHAGADVNHRGMEGNSPLHWAIVHGSVSMVKLFLVYGADPLQENDAGETPLQLATAKGEPREILELVKAAVLLR